MRRREAQPIEKGVVPEHLRIFRWADWPGYVGEAFSAWLSAREEWADLNGWPGGDEGRELTGSAAIATIPDEPWTDVLERDTL